MEKTKHAIEPRKRPKNIWLKATEENLVPFAASTPSDAELKIKNPIMTSVAAMIRNHLSILPEVKFICSSYYS